MATQINFFPIDAGRIYDDTISFLESYVSEPLYPGDERRLFGEAIVALMAAVLNKCNEDARQSLLRYAGGTVLDAMGERVRTSRLQPDMAVTVLRFSVPSPLAFNVLIPSGTRATPDSTHYFATKTVAVLTSGSFYVDIDAEATEGGAAHNGFGPGMINTIVDLVPYIGSVANLTTTVDGDDGEPYTTDGDDAYRERIRIAPAQFSTAGPEAAYRYYALSADADIDDVKIISDQQAGTINIVVLMKDGEGPSAEFAEKILSVVSDQSVRPLNDLVRIDHPNFIGYNIEFKYYVTAENEEAAINTIEGAGGSIDQYRTYQDGAIGRDINPDKLRALVLAPSWDQDATLTGALRIDVISPSFQVLTDREVARFSGNITVSHEVVEE